MCVCACMREMVISETNGHNVNAEYRTGVEGDERGGRESTASSVAPVDAHVVCTFISFLIETTQYGMPAHIALIKRSSKRLCVPYGYVRACPSSTVRKAILQCINAQQVSVHFASLCKNAQFFFRAIRYGKLRGA